MSTERLQVHILGVVQGVGFRPFVHRLATEENLPGWVRNDQNGVTLEVEGNRGQLLHFLVRLRREVPPVAWIHALDHRFLPSSGFRSFEIRPSESGSAPRVWVLPDLALCPDCRIEVLDESDRRHGYPFTNCTNCGPRFTIIEDMPYDRPNTSMSEFSMCDECRSEYEDPRDRRFHAQPNACPECGPQLEMLDRERGIIAREEPALQLAIGWLSQGRILGVKGLGGYHLMVDASDEEALRDLRLRKRRPYKAFALMYPDLRSLRRHVDLPDFAVPLLESTQAPILILPRTHLGSKEIAESVAPKSPSLGVFLPYTPLHRLLLAGVGRPLVATSANLSEQPMLYEDQEALEQLPRWCDAILRHDRRIVRPADDSVLQILERPEPKPQLLRRARGYAPLPVLAPRELPCILALGGEMNATFAVSRDTELLLSQHLGGLSHFEGRESYRRVLDDFLRLHALHPTMIAHDLHPDYFTSSLAQELSAQWQIPALAVQHHHAHLAACALENELQGEVVGLCWDGTGYGPDGTVWGGEVLLGDASGFRRAASLRPFRLPGSDAAAREGWRVALSLLYEIYGEDLPRDLPLFSHVPAGDVEVVLQMLRREVNSPVSTSMGRLFDGVAAILGVSFENTHQAQSPQILEYAAWRGGIDIDPLPMPITRLEDTARLDWGPMLHDLVERLVTAPTPQDETETLSAGFHTGLVAAGMELLGQHSNSDAVLTGGVFCNRFLTEGFLVAAAREGLRVHVHSQLPPTDGSLAVGQLWVAANRDL
jgi:hydrogenase maturation protein HypF